MKFYDEVDTLKNLYKNSYLSDLVEKCIKEFLDEILAPKIKVRTVPKKDLLTVLHSINCFFKYDIVNCFNNPLIVISGLFSRLSAK